MSKKPRECIFISRDLIDETLRQAPYQGKHLVDPFKSFAASQGLPFNILEDCDVPKWGNDSEVHCHEADLWLGLDGKVNFVYGGKMDGKKWAKSLQDRGVDNRELKSERIADGTESVLKRGDWIFIPEGQPHTHYGSGRMIIIKIPAKELISLDLIPGWKS